MKTTIILALFLLAVPLANACNAESHIIQKMIKSGAVTVTYHPNGKTVTCDTKKVSKHECGYVFEYFRKNKKG
jgi:hypothetical protein